MYPYSPYGASPYNGFAPQPMTYGSNQMMPNMPAPSVYNGSDPTFMLNNGMMPTLPMSQPPLHNTYTTQPAYGTPQPQFQSYMQPNNMQQGMGMGMQQQGMGMGMGMQQGMGMGMGMGMQVQAGGPAPAQLTSGGNQTGRKRALLIGINYIDNPQIKLNGCLNDTDFMKYMLVSKFGFNENEVMLMTDDCWDQRRPTKMNILQAMQWLVQGVQPGDVLYFHYSGHGSQVLDLDGDEDDGFDETILPVDFLSAGQIIDDDIHRILCMSIPFGAKLLATMDCCHSGTGMDLPYNYNNGNWSFSVRGAKKATIGDVILFSSCKDDQLCADSQNLAKVAFTGVLTFAFCKSIESGYPNMSYGTLLNSMTQFAAQKGFRQAIQLSSGRPIDLNTPFVV